ncbi:antibiotic biosynthesis monooxygenase [Suttonella sp. R2A3]|uniref:antibiotic biosynthesis monooxygenase family protein n=1 Tax=Suttonella sp. R2A3 TaxID=2908648 RepID=UPI001F37A16F|nr:antibiotic biosynthesis monooxygenase family protein [Suttonella sp. R2A3]UJF24446.1 antibiotic biosynthesis monooxygenase [Suttonella sp. R2A3]
MYVTMNRFKIKPQYAEAYVDVWQEAQVRVADVDGFLEFKFFRLDSDKPSEYVLFSSYAVWENKDKFLAWTRSEHFKKSHRSGANNRHMYVEKPHLECFDALI